MISMFFGIPGVGKTTLLAAMALKYRGKYKHIYSNVRLKIDGITYIDDECIGKYELEDCLILIDEASIFADNRDYKSFNKNGTRLEYFLTHRHHRADIFLFTQGYNAVDKKLRTLTVNLYYMQKTFPFGLWWTKYYPIKYGIAFPTGENLGEIAEGYSKPPLIMRLFTTKHIYRPKYYKYFDSWEIHRLPDLPEEYQPYKGEQKDKKTRKKVSHGKIADSFRKLYQEGKLFIAALSRGKRKSRQNDGDSFESGSLRSETEDSVYRA